MYDNFQEITIIIVIIILKRQLLSINVWLNIGLSFPLINYQ